MPFQNLSFSASCEVVPVLQNSATLPKTAYSETMCLDHRAHTGRNWGSGHHPRVFTLGLSSERPSGTDGWCIQCRIQSGAYVPRQQKSGESRLRKRAVPGSVCETTQKNGGGDFVLAATGFWHSTVFALCLHALMQEIDYSIAPASADGGSPEAKSYSGSGPGPWGIMLCGPGPGGGAD